MTCLLRGLAVHMVLLACVSCSQPADDIIRFGLQSAPKNLDPRYATDATSARLNRLLYQRLVEFDNRLRPVPGIARWELRSPTQYRFHLDPQRAPFQNGQPLTADDVAATYRSVLDPGNASPHASSLRLLESIQVIDSNTLDFTLSQADPLFPGYLVIGLLPARAIRAQHPFHQSPLGSGAFTLQAWPEPGRLLLVRRADGQQVEFQVVGDPTVRVLKLLRGEIDLLQNDLPAELLGYLEDRDTVQVHFGEGSNFAYIGFNLQDPLTGQRAVRQAIACAIDREAIIEHVFAGAARLAAALLPPDHWAGDPALTSCRHDLRRARVLLQQAGYDSDHPLALSYKTSTDPLRVRIATIIQAQLHQAGIAVKLQSYDWGTFFGDIKSGHFQMYSLAWVGIKTPDIFRYAFHSESLPPAGANRGRLDSASVDGLIEAAERAETLPGQAAGYRRVQQALLAGLPYIPLWYEDHVFAAGTDIQGYSLARDGNYDGLKTVQKRRSP